MSEEQKVSAMSAWQPIESAPQLRNVLTYSPENGVDTSVKDEAGTWWGIGETPPTHWMPLPDPPSSAAQVDRDSSRDEQ